MKKVLILTLAMLLALSSTAFAFDFTRFDGAENVTVRYDPSEPASYRVTAGFGDASGWNEMGGHVVVRYMNAGKYEELPLILVAFTTSGTKATQMEIRTDAHRYSVRCTDLAAAGLTAIDSEGMVLVTPESASMLRDLSESTYARVTIWDEDPAEAFSFQLDAAARSRLALFLDEYEQEIVPMLTEGATLTKVYRQLTATVSASDAPVIGAEAVFILGSQYTTLENGSSGDRVQSLQQRLISLGFLEDKADGYFGSRTAAAVTRFQASVGVAETGVADEITQIELLLTALCAVA